jgi:hypothetical protein
MYLTYDWILIGLYVLISFFLLLFAAYAAREWRFERRQKIANVHAAKLRCEPGTSLVASGLPKTKANRA